MSDLVRDIFSAYRKWICDNPQKIGDYETLVKWVSYLIAGRINNSIVLSELVYSLSNLLVLCNDRILLSGQINANYRAQDNLKIYLTVIEYSEVFFELSAQKLWGSTGKWIVVVIIQVIKCLLKLVLVHQHREPFTQCPAISPLNRAVVSSNANDNDLTQANFADTQKNAVSFSLKRSGKVIRKIESAPVNRDWKPVEHAPSQQLFAETLYILKPLIHLSATSCFGANNWKPWMISLLADFFSLRLYRDYAAKGNCLPREQNIQISKRYLALLMYLLRSPFYEKYTKEALNNALERMGKTLPLVNIIITPLQKYIPFWQSNYFYMWSS